MFDKNVKEDFINERWITNIWDDRRVICGGR